MEDGFPDHMKCPVCLEIPEKEIFQCRNGHIHCAQCSVHLKICPECREALDGKKIRSRALELMLDSRPFECSNKVRGCDAKLYRKNLLRHEDSCLFGSTFDLCKALGYPNCEFLSDMQNFTKVLAHLQQDHGFPCCKTNRVGITLTGFRSLKKSKSFYWTPVILEHVMDNLRWCFLLKPSFSHQDTMMSISCVGISETSLSSTEEVSVHFTIKPLATFNSKAIISWATGVSKARSCDQDPPILLRHDVLESFYADEKGLTVYCEIRKKSQDHLNMEPINKFDLEMQATVDIHSTASSSSPSISTPKSFTEEVALLPTLSRNYTNSGANYPRVSPFPLCAICKTCNLASYKCSQCPDYEICLDCESRGDHCAHVLLLIEGTDQRLALQKYFQINAKSNQPVFDTPDSEKLQDVHYASLKCGCGKDLHYLCMQCRPMYGYCHGCFANRGEHLIKHIFGVVNSTRKLQLAIWNIQRQWYMWHSV